MGAPCAILSNRALLVILWSLVSRKLYFNEKTNGYMANIQEGYRISYNSPNVSIFFSVVELSVVGLKLINEKPLEASIKYMTFNW